MKPTIIERARAYLARMPVSVQGQGGSDAAFNAASKMVKGFSLSEDVALALMNEDWNPRCLPPWKDYDLRHKLQDAAKSSLPDGFFLDKDDEWQPHQRHAQQPAQSRETEQERKIRLRTAWPTFRKLSKETIEGIARLRGIEIDAVDLAHRVGLLRGAMIDGHRCFVIHEGTFAQTRRLDGQPFEKSDGSKIKAKNLPGSEGAFIGRAWLYDAPNILLVEGCIGALEAMAATLPSYVLTEEPWAVIAATSASSRFNRDPDLLTLLAGLHIRIVPDNDQAGLDAAASWMADLEGVGARVEIITLPDGTKDIGDLLKDPQTTAETLSQLFK